nr:hypothetical protein A6C57_13130 [Fibrella sp. ES10-3-2-2]
MMSCWQSVPHAVPFKTQIAGVAVAFPTTVGQLRQAGVLTKGNFVQDLPSMRVIWCRNPYTNNWLGGSLYPVDSMPIYGVSIYLRGKANSLDSLKLVLEQQFKMPLNPFELTQLNRKREPSYFGSPPIYSCSPSVGTLVSVRLAACWVGDYPYQCGKTQDTGPSASDNPENMVRIAISFGLNPQQAERFAAGSGTIWPDD